MLFGLVALVGSGHAATRTTHPSIDPGIRLAMDVPGRPPAPDARAVVPAPLGTDARAPVDRSGAAPRNAPDTAAPERSDRPADDDRPGPEPASPDPDTATAAGNFIEPPEGNVLEPPAVDPGGIATVVVAAPLPPLAAGDTLDYELHLASGFRPYFPRTGFLAVPDGTGEVRVPLTFGVPAGAPAGRTFAGRLRLRSPGGTTVSDSIWVEVNAVYEVEARLTALAGTVEPGGPVELRYRVLNRGNAVDTVALGLQISSGWEARRLPARVELAAGDTAEGVVVVTAPRDVFQGHERAITLVAAGAGRAVRSTVSVLVAADDPTFLGGWAHLPSTIFVGGSLGSGAGGSLAIEGAGEVAPGTRLTLSVRRRESVLMPPAFQDHMFGPRFRMAVRRSSLRISAGEVQTLGGALSSPVLSGRGFEGRVETGRWTADLHAARPGGLGSSITGHQLRTETRYATDRGEIGLTLADIREEWPWTPGYRSTGAGVGYRLPENDRHDLWLQAGVLSVRADSGESVTGATVDARYRLVGDAGRLELRGRLVPGTVITNTALGNELFANGVVDVAPRVTLKAWGQLRRTPVLGTGYEPETSALFVGARAAIGPAQVEAGGLRRRTGTGIGPAVERRAAALGLDLPVGAVALQADALIGRFERGVESGPVRELWSGAQWFGARTGTWARLGARYTDSEYADGQLYFDLSGATELRRLRLEGGLSSRLQDDLPFEDGVSLWSSVQVEAVAHTFVTAGADFQPGFGDGGWRFSLGVSRDFGLPVPVRHTPDLHGRVFEDRNGNRLHDPGEPVLPGVRLQAGGLETRTKDDGTFAFRRSFGGTLRVDPASLPVRMALPPDLHLPSSGEVEIPVVEAGAVEVDLFMDRNGDGQRDPAEEPAAEVLVSLVDARGATRDLESDDAGLVRFGAVSPGDYTLRVIRRAAGSGLGAPMEREVRVAPGRTTAVTLAVPARARTIRMGTGAELGSDPGS